MFQPSDCTTVELEKLLNKSFDLEESILLFVGCSVLKKFLPEKLSKSDSGKVVVSWFDVDKLLDFCDSFLEGEDDNNYTLP